MASHVINNIADSYARKHDAMEWKNEIKRVVEEHGNQSFYIFWLLCQKKKLYDFKRTKQRKVYDRSSKSKRIRFFRTPKKMLFLKVVKRRITKEPLNSEFLDEIHFTIVVYKYLIVYS